MNKNSAILRYTCRLLRERMSIIGRSLDEHRLITEAEIAQIEWIDEKAKLIRSVQLRESRKENVS